MPDWSYQTVLKPILFRLPAGVARSLSLGAMGTLARLPLGPFVIDFLGHMRPDPRLGRDRLGIHFPGAVGLGAGIDRDGMAVPALARFGFGFLELGPVAVDGPGPGAVGWRAGRGEIVTPDGADRVEVAALAGRLARCGEVRVPLFVRLAASGGSAGEEFAARCSDAATALGKYVRAFTLMLDPGAGDGPPEGLGAAVAAIRDGSGGRPVLVAVPADLAADAAGAWVDAAQAAGAAGFVIDPGLRDEPGVRRGGPDSLAPARGLAALLRRLGPDAVIVASGGVHCPSDALDSFEAGADFVQIDSGFVAAGPGLPKRINDAVLARDYGGLEPPGARPAGKMAWFWAWLMGLGMLLGGALALAIAATRVVLPYDEHFAGLDRAGIAAINPRLLPFMTHDRVTLAGVMLTLGVLYVGLARGGIRRGWHWAWKTVVVSASVGFASFFLFLGFGYLDPLHAFVTVALFQFLLMAVHADLGTPRIDPGPGLFNDRAWRLAQWGQLLVIVQATLFLLAGVVIATVGVTRVFVAEDLEFLGTTPEALAAAGPRLVPVVAHDRAVLGGMLVCSGLGFLLPALWGFQRGRPWLWWTLAIAAVPGFLATSVVHLVVGYHDPGHLAPVLLGAGLMGTGLALSYPYLRGGDPATAAAWGRIRRPG